MPELRPVLQTALDLLSIRRTEEFSEQRLTKVIEGDGPAVLREVLQNKDLTIRGSTGLGIPADVPWIGIFPPNADAQEGYYLVYLFAADGSTVYLSLNQGTERVKGGTPPIEKRAVDLRDAVGDQAGLLAEIDLRSPVQRAKRYEAGNAYAVAYARDRIPGEDVLNQDVRRMLQHLTDATTSGLRISGAIEPVHLLFKWSADREPATIERHKAIAEAKGSVWWGKWGNKGSSAVSSTKLEALQEQLSASIPTFAFLYRSGEMWRAQVEQIAADEAEVDEDRLPDYYGKSECNLFVRLRNFCRLDPNYGLKGLLLASNPDPERMGGALGNQTTPLLVFERGSAEAPKVTPISRNPPPIDTSPAAPALTLEWLAEQTLWPRERLEEITSALQGTSTQLILAGPPGTSKTWAAKAIARFVTQDRPLAHRIVQFHPSYSYEEFIAGLRPVTDASGHLTFRVTPGAVLRFTEQMEDPSALHVMIIDEINRANLPRVLGELMYLFEYRDEQVDLQYTPDFSLPAGLRFLGTMNTADRSIRSIDTALRRRFEIFECPASSDVLAKFYERSGRTNDVPSLISGFERMNLDLEKALDRHHTIGHTFFMASKMTPLVLRRIWTRKVLPLIEEYFFDSPAMLEGFVAEEYWPELSRAD